MTNLKKTTYRLLLFLPLVVLLVIGEVIVRGVPNSYTFKDNWINQNGDRVKVLVMGPSFTYYGIHAESLSDSAFNLANNNEELHYSVFVLKKYLPKCKNLEKIIFPIGYTTFWRGELEDNKSEWYRCISYKLYMDCPYHSIFSKYSFEFSNPIVFKKKLLKWFRGDESPGCDEYGWGDGMKEKGSGVKDSVEVVKKVIEQNQYYTDINRERINLSYLTEIINYCHDNGVELCFITTPVMKAYLNNLNKSQYNRMYSLIHDLCNKHNIRFYDFFRDNNFENDDFYDALHLNDMGARKFSLLLKQCVM